MGIFLVLMDINLEEIIPYLVYGYGYRKVEPNIHPVKLDMYFKDNKPNNRPCLSQPF
jgi:hypothetical protein